MTKIALFAAALAVAAVGCKKKANDKPAEPPKGSADMGSAGSGSSAAMTPGAGSGSGSGSGAAMAGSGSAGSGSGSAAATAEWDGKTRLEIKGFEAPESAYYDGDQDVYFVTNVNGKPLDADDNGFISKVSPDGKIIELKWIDGAKDNIKLNAPKGIIKEGRSGILYVADIDVVRKFDAKTGEPKGEVKVDGATFLNDVAIDGDGGIYVTDSGLDASFGRTNTDALYRITKEGKVTALIKDKVLGAPNGVTPGGKDDRWMVSFATGELMSVDYQGKIKHKPEKLPKGQLDGVVEFGLGRDLLISSWEGKAVYRGQPGGPWKAVVENQESPADIGYDDKRQRILIPSMMTNTFVIVPITE